MDLSPFTTWWLQGLHSSAICVARALRSRQLGEGGSRVVHAVTWSKRFVLKYGKHGPDGNRNEWRIWQIVAHSERARLFARCYAISRDGRYLLMERLRDLTDVEQNDRPPMPVWVTDRKRSAYGADKWGSIKLRDYGVTKETYDYVNATLVTFPSHEAVDEMQRLRSIIN